MAPLPCIGPFVLSFFMYTWHPSAAIGSLLAARRPEAPFWRGAVCVLVGILALYKTHPSFLHACRIWPYLAVLVRADRKT